MRRLLRSPEATWRRLPHGVVLALAGSRAPLQLNSTGALAWDLLADPISEASIVAELAETLHVPLSDVSDAISPLLGDLLRREAIIELATC